MKSALLTGLPASASKPLFGVSILDTALLLWGVVFGSIGLGFFIYGKKQNAIVPLVCGVALMVVPYFIANALLLVIVCAAIIAVPYFFRD